ncbi:PRKC apoptosis WT1 regulator protein [Sceloporus undulatus]|uniref:PRKC apoptosis WT1 regulator protein n=1 Tax=Sceloporus undulatus TaxID=8520 RepID=UPI001C4C2167|nr:PRKC apoptosis WT1 regulator protein [Sceloporus undulatus]XP_042325109.1 PRKC apoptosis WT1 regulator protein [Sceloporus undulatus]
MATGGYRGSSGATSTSSTSTTDFLEEWKAKREKMRAKQAPPTAGEPKAPGPPSSSSSSSPTGPSTASSPERSPNCAPSSARSAPKEPPAAAAAAAAECPSPPVGARASPAEGPGAKGQEKEKKEEAEEERVSPKGKGSSGPSARKGKGQIEKRKLREKRRSTGVVNLPATESLDEFDDDEAGQKERKREDAITQQNTMQNESASADSSASYILQDTSRTISNRYKSTTNMPDDDVSSRYSRAADRAGYNRYNREANSSGNIIPNNSLEKKIEDLEKELAKERQENLRLVRIAQDKEELIGKLKEEIDLLNRDLDDIEDENEQLKQENKTLLKVVGQLTR